MVVRCVGWLPAHPQPYHPAAQRRDGSRAGLAVREFEVLLKLESVRPGGLRMTDLVERVYLTPSGLSRLVDRMQRRGLVLRGIDSDDLRAARSRRPRPALSSTGGRRARTVNGFGGASWSRCRPNRAPPGTGMATATRRRPTPRGRFGSFSPFSGGTGGRFGTFSPRSSRLSPTSVPSPIGYAAC